MRRFLPKDVLRETMLTHLAVAPDGESAVSSLLSMNFVPRVRWSTSLSSTLRTKLRLLSYLIGSGRDGGSTSAASL